MLQLTVSPRNEEFKFGENTIKFNEFLKFRNGVLSTVDGTVVETNSDIVKLLSVIDGKLAFNGVKIDSQIVLDSVLTKLGVIDGKLTYDGIVVDTNITLPDVVNQLSVIDGKLAYDGVVVGAELEEVIVADDSITVLGSALRTETNGDVVDNTGTGVLTPIETTPENISYDYLSSETNVDRFAGAKVLIVDGHVGWTGLEGIVGHVYEIIDDNGMGDLSTQPGYADTQYYTDLGEYVPESTSGGVTVTQNIEDTNFTKYQIIADNVTGDITVNDTIQIVSSTSDITEDVLVTENISYDNEFDGVNVDDTGSSVLVCEIGVKILLTSTVNGGMSGHVYERVSETAGSLNLDVTDFSVTANWADLGEYVAEHTEQQVTGTRTTYVEQVVDTRELVIDGTADSIEYTTYKNEVSVSYNDVVANQESGETNWIEFTPTLVDGDGVTLSYSVNGVDFVEYVSGPIECDTDNITFRVDGQITQIDVTTKVKGKITIEMMARTLYDLAKGNSNTDDINTFIGEFEKVYL